MAYLRANLTALRSSSLSPSGPTQSTIHTKPPRNTSMSQVEGRYIVVFKDEITSDEITKYVNEVNENGGEVGVRFDENGGILNGFAAKIPDSFLQSLKSLEGDVIKYIEPDSIVTTQ